MQQDDHSARAKAAPRDRDSPLCLYPSKRCDNPRVTKANGELHKFCQFHRDKANYNQRQLEFKRMLRQEQAQSAGAQTASVRTAGPPLLPRPQMPLTNNDGSESEFELDEEHIRLIEEVASATGADALLGNQ
ncbi:hypothetical protein PHYSODRAFT_314164 [Phytophthora sojae]|uniref:Uncharacterized protein n=1 Tax=Phytophthora sojae (strain P6497) TaxID=1094619 RepID=G4Z9I0_PHYSP|nr:hypothetical protein PHYSODRAFT_314164 [Phytophthora sojae]EGZ22612.1 hypothetical protein PHYSODRAFT_314164 [Phytophthora sojae]|eukprot:XP_009525329.1 hypothetical protein PHYSODRAFT_314164 [Phytophthora sojae]